MASGYKCSLHAYPRDLNSVPSPMSGDSWPPVTPVLGDMTLSSGLWGYPHIHVYIHTDTHTHTEWGEREGGWKRGRDGGRFKKLKVDLKVTLELVDQMIEKSHLQSNFFSAFCFVVLNVGSVPSLAPRGTQQHAGTMRRETNWSSGATSR